MRYTALYVLMLAISEPLLIHAKVLVILPSQKTRRSPAPWRPPYKKSFYGSNDFRKPYYGNRYYSKKSFRPYPSGKDDFDQGYDAKSHMYMSHGKDVGHSISFGKPYIPYNMKGKLPFEHERYAGAYARQPSYSPADITASIGQEYVASATMPHSYESPHVDSFFSDMDGAVRASGLHEGLMDSASEYYSARTIEKDPGLRNQQALSSVIEKDPTPRGTEVFVKDIPPTAYTHVTTSVGAAGTHGSVVLPAGIPSATIAGNKNGIVLRDTVSMDEYHRKLEELAKTWPNVLSDARPSFAAAAGIPVHHHHHQQQQMQAGFPTAGLPGSASFLESTNWLAGFAQPKQGYAVREDHGDQATYDFRTMPVRVAFQQLPFGANLGMSIAPSVHG